MIKFRQKNFAWPALATLGNAAMIGGTAWSIKQGSDQAKQAERHQQEAIEQQRVENAKLTKALDKIAKEAAKNPQAAVAASDLVRQNKTFAIPASVTKAAGGFFKNIGQFAKEAVGAVGAGSKSVKVSSGKKVVDRLGRTGRSNKGKLVELSKHVKVKDSTGIGKIGKTMIGLGTMGAITTGASYAVDKAITADARKVGMMPGKNSPQQKAYTVPVNPVMSKIGNYAKKGVKYTFSKKNLLGGGNLLVAGFAATPAIGYLSSRAQYKDQLKQQSNTASQKPATPIVTQQKSYAIPAAATGSLMKGIKSVGKTLKKPFKNWAGMKTITGGAASLSSFGNFGRREIQAYGGRLAKGNHAWSKKAGNWILANPNKANLVGAGIGSVMVGGSLNAAEKLSKKAIKAVDKDAFAYEKYQNQQVN